MMLVMLPTLSLQRPRYERPLKTRFHTRVVPLARLRERVAEGRERARRRRGGLRRHLPAPFGRRPLPPAPLPQAGEGRKGPSEPSWFMCIHFATQQPSFRRRRTTVRNNDAGDAADLVVPEAAVPAAIEDLISHSRCFPSPACGRGWPKAGRGRAAGAVDFADTSRPPSGAALSPQPLSRRRERGVKGPGSLSGSYGYISQHNNRHSGEDALLSGIMMLVMLLTLSLQRLRYQRPLKT